MFYAQSTVTIISGRRGGTEEIHTGWTEGERTETGGGKEEGKTDWEDGQQQKRGGTEEIHSRPAKEERTEASGGAGLQEGKGWKTQGQQWQ